MRGCDQSKPISQAIVAMSRHKARLSHTRQSVATSRQARSGRSFMGAIVAVQHDPGVERRRREPAHTVKLPPADRSHCASASAIADSGAAIPT